MSGHPIYYPWQGRAPQPPSPPTHSFNPWQPRAHEPRLPPPPPGGTPTARRGGVQPRVGGTAGVEGGRTPHPVGQGSGSGPPSTRPCSGTWCAPRRARAGPAATSAVLCRGGQPAAAGAAPLRSARPRHGSTRPLPPSRGRPFGGGRQVALLPPAGLGAGWAQGSRDLPASGLLRVPVVCAPHASAVPPRSFVGPLFSSIIRGK